MELFDWRDRTKVRIRSGVSARPSDRPDYVRGQSSKINC